MTQSVLDVLIVGAGISGIGAAVHLTKRCPGKSFAIIEARNEIGGTWDLFRYPGIRSDSDMYTLGFNFKPWTAENAIADAPTIMGYLRETVDEYGLAKHIRFDHKMVRASWSSESATWTVDIAHGDGSTSTIETRFIFQCSGYYDYDQGYRPTWDGEEKFGGQIVHPQFWPDDLDYADRKVVVIGSGATAVTLVPAMAETAEHVTMLQRSPTYITSRPAKDKIGLALRKVLPSKAAYLLTRWKNVLLQLFFYNLARKRPAAVKKRLLDMVREEMGEGVDMTHFTPSYNPWDQRLCLVPDSDMFAVLKQGKASIVTDHIERFDATGIRLQSGEHLDADIVIAATGLKISVGAGVEFVVDGEPVHFGSRFNYKGVMFSDVPNFGLTMGYTNASWTLKADLTSEYLCRVVNKLDEKGAAIAVPRPADPDMTPEPILDFTSGYVQRALADLPKQGPEKPWRLNQNYAKDIVLLRHKSVEDGVLRFEQAHVVEDGRDESEAVAA